MGENKNRRKGFYGQVDWRERGTLAGSGPLVEGHGVFPHGRRTEAEARRKDRKEGLALEGLRVTHRDFIRY